MRRDRGSKPLLFTKALSILEAVNLSTTEKPRPARNYGGAGWIGSDPFEGIEILRIVNAIGNAAAQSSAMTQNARGPSAP